jgi:hypothetical protein
MNEKKARVYEYDVIAQLKAEMAADPWHVKARRWWTVQSWFWRRIWAHRFRWATSAAYRAECRKEGPRVSFIEF